MPNVIHLLCPYIRRIQKYFTCLKLPKHLDNCSYTGEDEQ